MLGIVALLVLHIVAGSVLQVPSAFPSIAAAVAAARPGDVVQLAAGLFSGPNNCDVLVTTDNLQIAGAGRDLSVVDCGHTGRCLRVMGVRCTISGVHFRNGQAPNTPLMADKRGGGVTGRAQVRRG